MTKSDIYGWMWFLGLVVLFAVLMLSGCSTQHTHGDLDAPLHPNTPSSEELHNLNVM